MFTIDIDISPPPIDIKNKNDNSGNFHLYHISGVFYLPNGFLMLISRSADKEFKEAINMLNYVPAHSSHIYNISNNLGISPRSTNPNDILNAWSFNAYIKCLSKLDNVLEVFEDFLKWKLMEINPEDGISNSSVENIKNLLSFGELEIKEIHNPQIKKKIEQDFF